MEAEIREIREHISRHAPFDGLTDDLLDEVAGAVEIAYAKAGSTLSERDGSVQALSYIRSGAVEVYRHNGQLYSRLGEGDIFGQFDLLRDRQVRFPVKAIEDTLLYRIPKPVFDRLCATDDDFADFLELSGSRLQTVAVRVTYVKQRQSRTKRFSLRRMRRARTPIMAAWIKVRPDPAVSAGFDRPHSLFGLPPQDVGREITRYVTEITGIRRTPYDMRHTAARRLADVGANRLLIAEFLTHDNINTANAHIENSPAQAEIVNRALGQSRVFQKLDAEIKRRSISASEHARLDPDQKFMNAPNGYPIIGIGGCKIGQSFCTKTPALACYTCPKFRFLRDDVEVHRNAVAAVRSIV